MISKELGAGALVFPNVKLRILSDATVAPIFRIQECRYPDACSSLEHANEFNHAILTLSGCAVFQERGCQELRCEPGSVLSIPANAIYKWRIEGETRLFQCLHHPFNFIEHRALANLFGRIQAHLVAVKLQAHDFAAMGALVEADMARPADELGLLLSFDMMRIMSLASLALSQGASPESPPALAKAVAYLEANVHRTLSVADISRHSGLASSRLTQLFREHTGKSPMQFFAFLKAKQATLLLQSDGLRACEVAALLGFSSESYFRRFYKLHTGKTPGSVQNRSFRQ